MIQAQNLQLPTLEQLVGRNMDVKTVRTCEQFAGTEEHDWFGKDNLADLYHTEEDAE